MNNPYYRNELFLAQVDLYDNTIGLIERWRGHRDGILHRGFTVILAFNDKFILQHRKHLAFDNFWDLTFSSHQIYQNNTYQSDLEAITAALNREWNISASNLLGEIQKLGHVYYQAKDPNSIYTEHEIDYVYLAQIRDLPQPNLDFAYGYELVNKDAKQLRQDLINYQLCPWVKEILDKIPLLG